MVERKTHSTTGTTATTTSATNKSKQDDEADDLTLIYGGDRQRSKRKPRGSRKTRNVEIERQQQRQEVTTTNRQHSPLTSFGPNRNHQTLSPAILSPGPHLFLPPSAFGPAVSSPVWAALNGTSGHLLPPFVSAHASGASQFASLTPDARACVTATYLCVLIVNNTWLDCNLLDTLCSNNSSSSSSNSNSNSGNSGGSTSRPYPSTSDYSGSDAADQILRDAHNATRWLAEGHGKRDDIAGESALESALSGLISFAGGGGTRDDNEDETYTSSSPAHRTSTDQFAQQVSGVKSGIYLLPVDLAQSAYFDRAAKPAQVEPHDPGGGGGGSGSGSDRASLYSGEETSTLASGGGDDSTSAASQDQWVVLPQHFHRQLDSGEKLDRLVHLNEDKSKILDQYIKMREYQHEIELRDKQRDEDWQRQHMMPLPPLSSNHTTLTSNPLPETQTGSATGTITTTIASIPAGLVSWVGRPFRGWGSYSFWSSSSPSSSGADSTQQALGVSASSSPLNMPLVAEASTHRQHSVQILRPIDRVEQQQQQHQQQQQQQYDDMSAQSYPKIPPHSGNSLMSANAEHKPGDYHHHHHHHHHHIHNQQMPPSAPEPDTNGEHERQLLSQQQSQNHNNVIFGSSLSPADFDLASTSSPNLGATTPLGAGLMQQTSPVMGIYDLNTNNNNNNNQLIQFDSSQENPYQPHQHQSHHHRPGSHQLLQQQQQHHRIQMVQQQQQPSHPSTAVGMCKCELAHDPQGCMMQCGGMTTLPMTSPGHANTKANSMLIGMTSGSDDPGQMTTSSSFATPSTTMITSPSTTSSSTTTTTSATSLSTVTSLGPTGKMNPLDVSFLLYTRYHRDLAQELAHLNSHLVALGPTSSTPAVSSTATPSSSSSSQHNHNHHHHHHHHHTSVSSSGGQISASDIIDLTDETTLNESHLNSSLPIKIIIHGFGSGGRRLWVTDMVYKLLDYEDVNVIVVDWEKGAALPNYVQAAGNTRIVGHKIAQLIKSINAKYGLTGNQYHLIGFSLGAHVAGFAGMEIRNSTSISRHWINRITGLDPASPLFENYEANDRLDPSDAQFVDVIHSNGDGVLRGGFGSLQPMGHVDFYPNGGRVQVGCNSVILSALSDIIYGKWQSLCNHRRALNFFMDSFEFSKCRFRSFNCDSYESYLRGECFDCGPNDEKCSYMGYLANYSEGRGKMYLTTHEEAPFCANQFIIKIVGSKGYKTHWGKVEVTLVTGDGKNESFWLSSMGSTSGGGGGSSTTGGAASGQSTQSLSSTPSMSPASSGSTSPASVTLSSTLPSIGSQYGDSSSSTSASNPTGSSTSSSSSRDHLNQQNMQSLIVAHPNLVNFTQIILRYTKYKGWIYSGDESWPIDKVFITDSDGQVKSFCGHNTVLESHITTRLNLEPGNCSVVEPMALANSGGGGGGGGGGSNGLLGAASASQVLMNSQQVGGNPHSRTSAGGGGGIPGQPGLGVGPSSQPVGGQQHQQPAGQQQQSVNSINGQNQQHQQSLAVLQQSQQSSSARTPRLLASIMQSAVGAGPVGIAAAEQQHHVSAQHHQSGMTLHAMQRMLSPQQHHQQQFMPSTGVGGGGGGHNVGGTLGLGGRHQAALSHQIMAF